MRNRKAALSAIAAAASLALTLSACGQDSDGGSEDTKGDAKGSTVGIAMPTKSSERWIADGANVEKNLKAAGYKTKLAYGEDDPDTQVSQIENMITQGVSALIIAAIDNKSLDNVLQQAKDAKIPVISYDRLILNSPNVDYYASFDNEKVGELQGTQIVEKLGLKDGSKKGPFNVELFAGSNDDNNTQYFFNGAMKVLQPFIDKKQLVVKSGQTKLTQVTTLRWDGGTAQKRMEELLTAAYRKGKVDAVLSPYDGISIGILSALKSDDYGKSKPMPVVTGQDAEVASLKSIKAGRADGDRLQGHPRAREGRREHGRLGAQRQEARDQRHQVVQQRLEGRARVPADPGERRQDQLPEGRHRLRLRQGRRGQLTATP
ncbi:putative multiple sugar transport system substrate-binding protein [Streptomyces umbrinus]|uniref:Multiple sugar transport system substrate-binding protein n=1 Tax=Streptomyces umbrinus TaxID=67370 RepID=A0ABU0T191_9ACTN|nr:putative multiple sugar transport system substrate-binding protein [Streptomyces umbrinus]